MKSLFSYITLASIILSGGALAEEVVGKWGTKKFYGFAEYGILSSDFNLNTTVTSGTLAVTSNVDSQGSIGKLGFGLSLSEKSAVELYAGKVSGISGTTTITATNAVIDGVTYNGSLSAIEDITADLIGINSVASDSYRFLNDSEMHFFWQNWLGAIRYQIRIKGLWNRNLRRSYIQCKHTCFRYFNRKKHFNLFGRRGFLQYARWRTS